MHIVLAGGGTAGHVEPALATADALRRLDPSVEVTLLGTATGLEARLVPERGYPLAEIPRVPLPRKPSPALLAVPGRLAGAVRAVRDVLRRTDAAAVVGFGGYVAMPAYLAAWRAKVPIVVHEANARPGLANRIATRLTDHVAAGFPDTGLRGARYVGTPLRRAIATLDRAEVRQRARVELGLAADRPTLLVFGGSQGARSLNEAAAAAAPALASAGVQVLHGTGPAHVDAVRAAVADTQRGSDPPPYQAVPYLDRMDLAYAAADLAVCRAGAMTCTELAAVGLPAVYVPLPHGNGEQRFNALPVVEAGGGLLVADGELTGDRLADEVLALFGEPERLAAMSEAAAGYGRRDADEVLAQWVLDVARAAGKERA